MPGWRSNERRQGGNESYGGNNPPSPSFLTTPRINGDAQLEGLGPRHSDTLSCCASGCASGCPADACRMCASGSSNEDADSQLAALGDASNCPNGGPSIAAGTVRQRSMSAQAVRCESSWMETSFLSKTIERRDLPVANPGWRSNEGPAGIKGRGITRQSPWISSRSPS
jgi:hypothetical protein